VHGATGTIKRTVAHRRQVDDEAVVDHRRAGRRCGPPPRTESGKPAGGREGGRASPTSSASEQYAIERPGLLVDHAFQTRRAVSYSG
jgi:hypothetical protein